MVSGENTVSPEEEEILLRDIPKVEDHSPGSKTALVSGGMANLQLTSSAHPGLGGGRLHSKSLGTPTNSEVLHLSSLLPQKTEERSQKLEWSQEEHEKTGVGLWTEMEPAN